MYVVRGPSNFFVDNRNHFLILILTCAVVKREKRSTSSITLFDISACCSYVCNILATGRHSNHYLTKRVLLI